MIAGIDGTHAWTPPGAGATAITLNDPDASPLFRVTRVTGLHSLAPAEDNRDPRVGGIGTIARPSQRREKSVTYEGRIVAETRRELLEGIDLIKEAFADVSAEGRMDVAFHPDNAEFADVPPVFFEARPVLCEVVDAQESKQAWRRFVLGLVMGDPRYFDEETEAHTVELEASIWSEFT